MVDVVNRIVIQGVDNTSPATRTAKESVNSFATSATASAKQTAAAMRMIPAQMTDIVVSLQSGQAPLTVLLQQGGQLKDMFGGVVPAAKALGTYLLALVNPFTLAAAGLATFALAYHQGSQESREFNKQLALTGGFAGLSTSQLMLEAAAQAKLNGTRSEAADVLAQLVATGKIGGEQFNLVASAASAMSKAGAAALKDIVAEFVQLGEEPVKASARLNEQHHYLTQTIYEQIKALDEQGKKAEAAALAQSTYASAMKTTATQVVENLSWIERSFKSVTGVAKSAWDAVVNSGRDKTGNEQLEGLKKQLAERRQRDPVMMGAGWEVGNQKLEKQIALLERVNKQVDEQAKKRGEDAKAQQAAIEATDKVNDLQDKAKGVSAVNRELEKYRANLEAIRKVNPNSDLLVPKNVKAGESAIRKQHAGSAALPKEDGLDASLARLKSAAEQEERALKLSLDTIKGDYDVGLLNAREYLDRQFELKQNALQRELDIAKQQETIARGKRNVAAVERYSGDVKRILDEMAANWVKNATDATVLAAKVTRAVDEYRESLNASFNTRQQSIDDQLMGAGLGAKALENLQRLTEARRGYDKAREQLRQDLVKTAAHGGIDQDQYDKQLAELDAYYQRRLTQETDYTAKSAALSSDWRVGATKALADYSESAADVAGQANKAFSGLYSGLEDAAVAWATGSKVSIKDVGRTFAAELVRMEVKASASSLYKMLGGGGWSGALGSLFGGTTSIAGANIGTSFAKEFGMTASGMVPMAKGGVFNSPSLSAYSNGIFDRPQMFAFAKGAGVFGEAGPEAIMPLRRGPDGRLGVAAAAPAEASRTPKVTLITQTRVPLEMHQERTMSDGEIVMMVREQTSRARQGAVRDVAGGFSDPNSVVSKGYRAGYKSERKF
ncbi:hypothetical protein BH10PSE18_BH10PSE18_15290 [soil metagenome]